MSNPYKREPMYCAEHRVAWPACETAHDSPPLLITREAWEDSNGAVRPRTDEAPAGIIQQLRAMLENSAEWSGHAWRKEVEKVVSEMGAPAASIHTDGQPKYDEGICYCAACIRSGATRQAEKIKHGRAPAPPHSLEFSLDRIAQQLERIAAAVEGKGASKARDGTTLRLGMREHIVCAVNGVTLWLASNDGTIAPVRIAPGTRIVGEGEP